MIITLDDVLCSCEQYRDVDGFCTRNCSCCGMSFGGNQSQYDAAREEAKSAGLTRYSLLTGKCGDWYIVPLDEMGRLI